MIDKFERMAMLFDFYGRLLTDKQQEMLSLYYEQDLSLSEIAEEYKISRQAVHDTLKRAEKTLEDLEGKLDLVKKFNLEQEKLAKVLSLIMELKEDQVQAGKIRAIIEELMEIKQTD